MLQMKGGIGWLAALAALSALMFGCGSHDPVAKTESQQHCLFVAEFNPEIAVVRAWIASGRLPRSEIGKHIPAGIPKRQYLDANGNLLPWSKIHGIALGYLDDWLNSLEHQPKTGVYLLKVQKRARDAASARCAKA
jgi:hypothetical protein